MVGWSISPLSLNPGVSVSPFISRPWDLCFSVSLSTLRSRNNEYTELIHAHSASEKHFSRNSLGCGHYCLLNPGL